MSPDRKMFSQVKPQRLSQLVETQIKEAIFSGELHMGDRLPSDRELAEMFGASRPVIREALRSLEATGLITVRTGVHGGAFLTPMTKEPIVESLSAMLKTGQVSHEEILQARLIIEPPVAAEAARLYTPQFEELLNEANRVLEEGFLTDDVYLEHNPNPNLHKVIAEITNNQLISIIMDVLMDKTVRRQSTIKLTETAKREVAKGHHDIVRAIKQQDEKAASRHMREHVLAVYRIHKELEPDNH